ncbi:MAG: HD-GYP domain-containing protein [Planctomycetaceae bacterium]
MRQIEDILQSTSRNVLDVHQQRLAKSNKRSEALRATVRALVTTLEGKDLYTWGHSNRVAELSRLTAMRLGLDVDCCERIYTAGLLHDVGKLGIPDTVLNKAAQLSSAEYNLIRLHPVIGFEIVQRVSSLADVAPAVLYHHEAFDGAGYPDGLVGDEIPLDARILGVADAFDAMTSARSYRNKMSPRRAEAILLDGCGRQWDAECVRAFLSATDGARLTIQQPSMTSVRLR